MRCRKKFPNIIIRSAKRWPPDDTGRKGAAAHETCVAVVRFHKDQRRNLHDYCSIQQPDQKAGTIESKVEAAQNGGRFSGRGCEDVSGSTERAAAGGLCFGILSGKVQLPGASGRGWIRSRFRQRFF